MEIVLDSEFMEQLALTVGLNANNLLPLVSAIIAIPLTFYLVRKIIMLFPK